jgi:hypothetical protein
MPSLLDRAGRWFLQSGVQEPNGGVARFYRLDTQQNHRISTEITGYAAATFVYLHEMTGKPEYLERAVACARFLTRVAWDRALAAFPFEYADGAASPDPLAYFFDSGIAVRGLLSVWRATRDREFLETARACGRSMATDFAGEDSEFHPILSLVDKQPVDRDRRWSRSPGCYQLKSALGWYELFEETGELEFQAWYDRALDYSLRTYDAFLAGEPERTRVMDRLHAFCYFLEGLLPHLRQKRCGLTLGDGLHRVARLLREIAPEFERSDVYAQLLRMRLFAEWAGVTPVDRIAASQEAAELSEFQLAHADPRASGGFCFGREGRELLPHVNPVSTAFALQALIMWRQYQSGEPPADWHSLI